MDLKRCDWCRGNEFYERYHDEEWGKPVFDDRKLFEFLILESFQAGLSWLTILKKRENFRQAFADFDVEKVAIFNQIDFARLMADAGIVRNRLKIEAAINNASRFLEIQAEFGSFSNYVWGFVNNQPILNNPTKMSDLPSKTSVSDALSKDLGKRGFKFRGTTICYAFMQAVGMVDDHLEGCWRRTSS